MLFIFILTSLLSIRSDDSGSDALRLEARCETSVAKTGYNVGEKQSFSANMLVATPEGNKPIEQLAVGAAVLSFNPETGQIETTTIEVVTTQHRHNMYELDFEGIKIKVTEDQPFYSQGKYYSVVKNKKHGVSTKALSVGQVFDFLINDDRVKVTLKQIRPFNTCENTVTITKLAKNNLYFANGACVLTGTPSAGEEESHHPAGVNTLLQNE